MPEELNRKFKVIDDLPMVVGTFCLDPEGQPLYSSLKAPFGDEVFSDLGPSVLTFFDGVAESYTATDEVLLNYGDFKLYLRKGARDRIIGALCDSEPNITSLRVGCNLVFRSLPEQLSPIGDVTTPDTSPEPESKQDSSGKSSFFGGSKPKQKPSSGGGVWG